MTITTPGRSQPRPTIAEYRRRRDELDQALSQLLAAGEVVSIAPPAATAAPLEQLQADWERLRARTVAFHEAQGKKEQEALEAEFYAGTVDVVAHRTATKAREARTSQAVAQAQAIGGVARAAGEDAAHAAGTEAVARVWLQVLQHGQQQLEQAQRAQDSHDKENAAS